MNPSGPAYQMQVSPVMNSSPANVRRAALGSAGAKNLSYSALLSVYVKASVKSRPCDRPKAGFKPLFSSILVRSIASLWLHRSALVKESCPV